MVWILGYKPVQRCTVLNAVGNCNTKLSIMILYCNIMGPPSYMRSVVDGNVMRRIPVMIRPRNGQKRKQKSAFISALRSSHLPSHWLPWALFPPLKMGVKLVTRCHLVTKQRIHGDIRQLPTCHLDVVF